MEDEKLLLAEYETYSEAFWRNEEGGEKRVNFFVTLTTALTAAVVALRTSQLKIPADEVRQIASVALLVVILFGLSTFLRMLQRDRVTDEYKHILRYLRRQLKSRAKGLDEYELPFMPSRHWLLKGGLAFTVALMNSVLIAVLVALWIPGILKWVAVVSAFFLSFVAHGLGLRSRNRGTRETSQTFRAGVGAVIVNHAGKVLALKRRDVRDAWQMPQGGLSADEDPVVAVKREIEEETGIREGDLQQIVLIDRLLAYELPKRHRSKKTGRGQVHYWFIFRFQGTDERITLGDGKEFVDWKWSSPEEVVSAVVWFKRSVYQELIKDLQRILANPNREMTST